MTDAHAPIAGEGGTENGNSKGKDDKDKGKEKEGKAAGAGKGAKGAKGKTEDRPMDISRLDLRVGLITKAWKHPEAESLYVEEIDLGEGSTRQVVSGLVKHVKEEDMQQR